MIVIIYIPYISEYWHSKNLSVPNAEKLSYLRIFLVQRCRMIRISQLRGADQGKDLRVDLRDWWGSHCWKLYTVSTKKGCVKNKRNTMIHWFIPPKSELGTWFRAVFPNFTNQNLRNSSTVYLIMNCPLSFHNY